ncbi:MAG: hypothetical protein GEV08_17450, partial [Acidimicrobiia bacterium]|nr:hypothetical protein [Acidimicrobiia bacterium]
MLRGHRVRSAAPLAFPVVEAVRPRAADIGGPALDPAVELEAARREAAAAGHVEGYAAGRAEGLEEARRRVVALLCQIDAERSELVEREERAFAELAAAATEVSFAVVEVLLGRELELATSPGRDALARALRAAPDGGAAVARLNPADLDLLGDVE